MIRMLSLIIVTLWASVLAATGDSADNPILIRNITELQAIKDGLDKHYKLASDIDASDTYNWNIGDHDDDGSTPDSAMGFEPIGNSPFTSNTTHFTGSLNGAGFVISDLYINRPSSHNVGIFGSASVATIDSLGVVDCNIIGSYYVGGVVGRGGSSVSYCYTTGSVTGNDYVGGVVGSGGSSVSYCYTTGNISGNDYVGGVVGVGGSVSYCYATGSVNGSGYVGGVVGDAGIVTSCYASCSVSGKATVGGVVGYSVDSSIVSKCFSIGAVKGWSNNIGGVVGASHINSIVNNCYATGPVEGNERVGGVVGGSNNSTVNNCYATGLINGTPSGGVLGAKKYKDSTKVNNSFWDTETSKTTFSTGGTSKTTNEMKMLSTFTDTTTNGLTVAWDFVGTENHDTATNDIWYIEEGITYPLLVWAKELEVAIIDGNEKPIVSNQQNNVFMGKYAWNGIDIIKFNVAGPSVIGIYNPKGSLITTLRAEKKGNFVINKNRLRGMQLAKGMYFMKVKPTIK